MTANPLFILDHADSHLKELLDSRNIKTQISVDYANIYKHVELIRNVCDDKKINLLAFSRNDQVKGKINIGGIAKQLRLGYTSFSSLENENWEANTWECLNDFLDGSKKTRKDKLAKKQATVSRKINERKTFSLVFDTEQLGCMKFGVPRLMKILDKHDVKATFFATNIVMETYPEIASSLVNEGHEIGLHGEYHEFLCSQSQEYQTRRIKSMLLSSGKITAAEIVGANFLGRYDENTINAMLENSLKYFAYDAIDRYRYIGYKRPFSKPLNVINGRKHITAIPVDAETYGFPGKLVKKMLSDIIKNKVTEKKTHVTVLMHPFRDGSLTHISKVPEIIDYMKNQGFSPIRLIDYQNSLDETIENCSSTEFFRTIKNRNSRIIKLNDISDFIPQWYARIKKRLFWPKVVY